MTIMSRLFNSAHLSGTRPGSVVRTKSGSVCASGSMVHCNGRGWFDPKEGKAP
jgi:hypothetical protein